ncbi:hypothetical protein ACN0AB_003851 [Escherichia coli]|nr:Uncharacterised protein [Escherichia coli]HAH9072063.1 hypothetical protein [Escherichia coli]HAI0074440.1 hypothetical protein [Escherichia coli]
MVNDTLLATGDLSAAQTTAYPILVLTLTTQRPFDDHTDQLWTAWLTSFQPAKS